MNDTRFKELLNLYLDHRIGEADAKELEQGMQANPALRKRLREYELMHRGCGELFRRSEYDAPAPDALVQALRRAEERMRAKNERRSFWQGWATLGTAAGAMALVALVVARVSHPGVASAPASTGTVAATQPRVQSLVAAGVQTMPNNAARTESAGIRRALPEHLTLAALGIAPEAKESNTSLGTWSAESESAARLASLQAETTEWMAVGQRSGWSASSATFSGRPISGWGHSGSGFQAQTAGFTFER